MFLDSLDKAILRQLQSDASISNLKLSSMIGLSAPACLKRVKRLEKRGVISKRVAILDQSKLGPSLHMIVEISMQIDRLDLREGFAKKVKAAAEVKECYIVTGEVDFVLVVVVPDMPSYEDFCQRVIYQYENLKTFRTLISMNRTKFTTQIEIPD
jgi:Lrp/AsnC family leucine-responsive transcriptional regulator